MVVRECLVVKMLVSVVHSGPDLGRQENEGRPEGGLYCRDLHDNERMQSTVNRYAMVKNECVLQCVGVLGCQKQKVEIRAIGS